MRRIDLCCNLVRRCVDFPRRDEGRDLTTEEMANVISVKMHRLRLLLLPMVAAGLPTGEAWWFSNIFEAHHLLAKDPTFGRLVPINLWRTITKTKPV